MKKALSLAAVSAAMLSAPLLGTAATDSTTFNVTLTLTASCTIDTKPAADLPFGTWSEADVSGATAITGSTSLDVTCSNGTPYTVDLSNGNNAAAGPLANRAMKSANASYVSYELYSDAALTTPWVAGTPVSFTGTGAAQVLDIFGDVPTQTPIIDAADSITAAGINLSDTVTVTLTY